MLNYRLDAGVSSKVQYTSVYRPKKEVGGSGSSDK
jgi:hypothetical protein